MCPKFVLRCLELPVASSRGLCDPLGGRVRPYSILCASQSWDATGTSKRPRTNLGHIWENDFWIKRRLDKKRLPFSTWRDHLVSGSELLEILSLFSTHRLYSIPPPNRRYRPQNGFEQLHGIMCLL